MSPRLPMTLNIVLKAKGDNAIDGNGAAITCSEIARRWLAAGELPLTGAELATRLISKDGPLDLIGTENIDRIETNLQIAHAPKSAARDFRTDYLLKVFRLNAQTQCVRGSAAGEPDRSRADFCRRRPQARIQGVAA